MFRAAAYRVLTFTARPPTTSTKLYYSTSLSQMGAPEAGYIESLRQKLQEVTPTRFYFKQGTIKILYAPDGFYKTLLSKISSAKRRVFIASLYLGKTETELVDCVSDALSRNPDLKVYFLLDGLRGTREYPRTSSATLLSTLVEKFGDERVDCRFYRTPVFRGWKKTVIPRRFNEGLGLQHMKIYGVDDEVILSGANLSNDYFSDRQDRYYIFQNGAFADYQFQLHRTVSSLSYRLKARRDLEEKFELVWPASNKAVEPQLNKSKFLQTSSERLDKFLHTTTPSETRHHDKNELYPTVVYPISQFTPLFRRNHDRSTELPSVVSMLSMVDEPGTKIDWTFTAGYFNMLPSIKHRLLNSQSSHGTVITASPYANGFYRSKGVSRHLPDAYLHLAHKFVRSVERRGKSDSIALMEWRRGTANEPGGWSYHAKGIWLAGVGAKPHTCTPFATIIGSSNYTKRAYSLDLESDAIVVTTDPELRREMQGEVQHLLEDTKRVTLDDFNRDSDRYVSAGVKLATSILGKRL
ncbi:CDP-diacylglycerol--glycerol-3-phosphate 3-phosphatidyltransferase KNAG_0I01160 [Huiozyma naganishii CBS 8797]|uniref:CDP-diacylglycerol--glycerol-3-phosphate 3-phosphatidyltransferase n=1 Tax=Huiozyma naganishii (strain ATCC MYA-139 / BCRC 22969 / CBS 8797 / KCTC 17520 / NBRC 10181 / NCYC 3082 / Yp74L-3) TaxID=1071383 RepID=J7S294_HUIN7|nr:hypothetical protein KNAG_0I01160 [Kazachstania naganishii CBS 8797]CCK71907.1 hypothetical protein KNAG_0I01160 [Kazachstania naganishii CBS 8797]